MRKVQVTQVPKFAHREATFVANLIGGEVQVAKILEGFDSREAFVCETVVGDWELSELDQFVDVGHADVPDLVDPQV